ncbi:MAG: hypothetical protein B7X83_03620 [Polynucleobacter sp. 17-46-58]|nr:MAG: hypothetical protein B7X83_03620 [Polynucleobacter sp. 17-46-58]
MDDLQNNNPDLHFEYLKAVGCLIGLVRGLALNNPKLIPSTSLSECYDTNTHEAYLNLSLNDGKNNCVTHIYIHQNNQRFMIGLNGGGLAAKTADEIMAVINHMINKLNWV